VPAGYPTNPKPNEITIDKDHIDATLFYASVDDRNGTITTTTSRALAVLGVAETIENAEQQAEQALQFIKGDVFARHDIGKKELVQSRIEHMKRIKDA